MRLFIFAAALFVMPLTAAMTPMGTYVGQLQDRWQFPSDHLPVGIAFDQTEIASWNVLDTRAIGWVVEKDTQGLKHSMIGAENVLLDQSELTIRDRHIVDLVLEMVSHPTHPKSLIALQESGTFFLKELRSRLPDSCALIFHHGEALIVDTAKFEILSAQGISGIFEKEPSRTFQEVYLRSIGTKETIRVLNVHLPGDPAGPARFEFAQYLTKTFSPNQTILSMGDMNFNEAEMSDALDKAFDYSPFSIYSPYCTNISPDVFNSKAIDHFIVYSKELRSVEMREANEVLLGLDQTLELLTSPAIEDSVVPLIEKAEEISYLNPKKYSLSQFAQIAEALSHKENRLRIATFNMLTNNRDLEYKENHRWNARLPRVAQAIRDMDPDLIGTQELSTAQLADLEEKIGDTYTFYGKMRSDGEHNGIFYRKDRLELMAHEVITVPGSEKEHGLTLVELKDKQTNRVFALYNIHMSFGSAESREKEARFISEQMTLQEVPAILAGDLNTFPQRLDLQQLPFYDGGHIHRILTQSGLKNSQEVSLLGHLGPISTFTNQPPSKKPFEGTGTPGVILDHIYVSAGISVLMHATQPVKVEKEFPSDHMPVLVDFIID